VVRLHAASLVALFTVTMVASIQQEAYAQSPAITGFNEVTLSGTWRIIAARGDSDDYWLVFDRPGGIERFKSEDDEIDLTINELGTWKLRLELEEQPEDCDARCDPAPIRYLRPDGAVRNRWRLEVFTPGDPDNDVELIFDRVESPVTVGPALFAVQLNAFEWEFSWPPFPGAFAYQLEVGLAPGRTDHVIEVGNRTSVRGSGPAGTYFVRVRAHWAGGLTGPSNEKRVTLGVCNRLPAPTLLQFTKTGTLVTLTWLGVDGSNNQWLLVGSSPVTPDNFFAGRVAPGFMQVDVSSVPAGTYYVRVAAENGCGLGTPSDYVAISIP
jgi:hypothetical protein